MSYVPPTLEGRAMVDLGQQLTAMRARAEQAEADNARLREALRKARTFIEYARYELEDGPVVHGTQFPTKNCADKELARIDAALAAEPAGASS